MSAPEASGPDTDTLLSHTKELYCTQGVSTTARAWNELREKVLQDALDTVLKPQFERELRSRLVSEARELVCSKSFTEVCRLASQGPYMVRETALWHHHSMSATCFSFIVFCLASQTPYLILGDPCWHHHSMFAVLQVQ